MRSLFWSEAQRWVNAFWWIVIACLLFALFGCSHLTVEDMRWVTREATNIDQVIDRLGAPEQTVVSETYEEAVYVDQGRHVAHTLFMLPPGIGAAIWLPFWTLDYALGTHYRGIAVRFDPFTGEITRTRALSTEECMRGGLRP